MNGKILIGSAGYTPFSIEEYEQAKEVIKNQLPSASNEKIEQITLEIAQLANALGINILKAAEQITGAKFKVTISEKEKEIERLNNSLGVKSIRQMFEIMKDLLDEILRLNSLLCMRGSPGEFQYYDDKCEMVIKKGRDYIIKRGD